MPSVPPISANLRAWLNGERFTRPFQASGQTLRLGDFLALLRGILAPGVEPVSLYVGDGKVLGFGNDLDVLLAHGNHDVLLHNAAGAGRFLAADDTFRIVAAGDDTKRVAFNVSAVSPGQTRVLTVPNADVDLGAVSTLTDDLSTLSTTVSGHTTSLSSLSTTVSGHTTSLSTLSTTVSGHTTSLSSLSSDVSALQAEKIDGVFAVSTENFHQVIGAWTRTRQAPGVYRIRRTPGTGNTDTLAIEVPLSTWRTTANQGQKILGVQVQYQVSIADVAEVTVALLRTVFPANGQGVANAATLATTYDPNHDTTAKRKAVGQHTLTATLASPGYLADGLLTVEITVSGQGAGTAQFDQFLLGLLVAETP